MNKKNKALLLSNRFAPAAIMAVLLGLLLVALLLAAALVSYAPTDPAWSQNNGGTITNSLGVFGAWYSDLSFSLIGKLSYLIPLSLVAFAVQLWFEKTLDKELFSWRLFMLLTAILSGCVLWAKHDLQSINTVAQTGGGALGAWLVIGLEKSVKSISMIMAFSLIIFAISLSLLFSVPWLRIIESIGRAVSCVFGLASVGFVEAKEKRREKKGIKNVSNETVMPSVTTSETMSREEIPTKNKPNFTIDYYQGEVTNEVFNDLEQEAGEHKMTVDHSMVDEVPPFNAEKTEVVTESFVAPQKPQIRAEVNSEEISPKTTSKESNEGHTEQKSEPNFFDFGRLKAEDKQETVAFEPTPARPSFSTLEEEAVSEPQPQPQVQPQPAVSASPAQADKLPEVSMDEAEKGSDDERFNFSLLGGAAAMATAATTKVLDMTSSTTAEGEPTSVQVESPMATPALNVAETVQPAEPLIEAISRGVQKTTQSVTIGQVYDSKEEPETNPVKNYELPHLNLLDEPPAQVNAYTEDTLAEMAGVLENTLKQFNVDATVMHVSPGPVITRFEIDLAPGIQAKKITSLSVDLARALAVSGVRVEEVIPGSSYVGLEVPNQQRQIVYFKDIVRSSIFQNSQSPLTISLGSDTSGKPVVADLMKMPHALVAGTTGSGKSVCINVMLLSMLYKATPKDLRLILVDPKMLEMSMYEDIPHLLTPVITDMNEAENALTWAVGEMERRYQLMAALKVRKIDAFNEHVDAANAKGEPIKDPLWEPNESVGYTHHPSLERLPFIVIVIDELADMMMVVGKQVEQLIARLTQKARAAGIHVVLATQRPSTDVLTGLIKANVPTRIAFQVSSGTDSRVIIDGVGAEKLLGHGDMLYVPPGAGHPQRLHGAFVGDAETDRITDFLRASGEANYIDGITNKQDPESLGAFGAAEAAGAKEDADPLYEEAVEIVLTTGKASISSVQRQLRIGYNRAARMIEDMQEQGIVSEPVNGVRKVLGGSSLSS